jgi:hypothetical protein
MGQDAWQKEDQQEDDDLNAVVGNVLGMLPRVATKINFVGILIGIPIEINFDFRRN